MIKIAVIGFGVVGSGVYEVLRENTMNITGNAGTEIDIKYILDIRDFSTHPESNLFVNDVNVIADDDEVKIVVETMGGLEPANTFTRQMLSKGKTVGDKFYVERRKFACLSKSFQRPFLGSF